MHLVQLLLPVRDPSDRPFPRSLYDDLAKRLTEVFGGITAYTRTPASGLWESQSGQTVRDDVVIYEVMVEDLDDDWWAALRTHLERTFKQDELVIRALEFRHL